MKKSINDDKKSRGRPPTTGTGLMIGLRWHEPELKAIDDWRRKQEDLPARATAIRRLVEMALATNKPPVKR